MGTNGTARRTPSRVPVLALSALVVLVAAALVLTWLWWLTRVDGLTRILWAVVGLVVVWGLLPRPGRLDEPGEEPGGDRAPALHRLVGTVAAAVGAAAPRRVLVGTGPRVRVVPVGYTGRTVLVVGLPHWTTLTPDERVAVLAHELACAQPRRRATGVLVRLADDLLVSAISVLAPVQNPLDPTTSDGLDLQLSTHGAGSTVMEGRIGRGVARGVGNAGLAVLVLPARLVHRLHGRLWRPVLHADALAADREAARVAGTEAVRGMLFSGAGVPWGRSAAGNAVRLGGDPVRAYLEAERPPPAELARRVAEAPDASVDALHPSTARRLADLAGGPPAGVPGGPDRGSDRAAAAEVAALHDALRPQLVDDLRSGRL